MIKEVQLPEIGWVTLQKKRNNRHIRLTLKPDGRIYVSLPYSASFRQGISFVERKKAWIIKHRKRLPAQTHIVKPGPINLTPNISLVIEEGPVNTIRTHRLNGSVTVTLPENKLWQEEHSEIIHGFVKKVIENLLKEEAQKSLFPKFQQLATIFGFDYQKVTLRSMSSRWGSCSTKKRISLNIHLVRLPEHLQDYVILHELVHTRIPNHGAGFWKELDRLTGGRAVAYRREMRKYSPQVY